MYSKKICDPSKDRRGSLLHIMSSGDYQDPELKDFVFIVKTLTVKRYF